MSGIKTKVDIMRRTFENCLVGYKRKMQKNPKKPPPVNLKWFHYAHFLDATGYLDSLKRKTPLRTAVAVSAALQEKEKPKSKAKPASSSKSSKKVSTSPRKIPLPLECPKEMKTEFKFEDSEMMSDLDSDEEGLEEGEFNPEVHGDLDDHTTEATTATLTPTTAAVPDSSHRNVTQQQVPPATANTSAVTAPTQIRIDSTTDQQRTDYFGAFLDYAKLRAMDYSARQKRDIINAVSSVMNQIDEENEAECDMHEYSYQLYPSMAAFNSTTKE